MELRLPPSWRVATGMPSTGHNTFSVNNYHDLVDFPIVAGRFDFDSTKVGTGWLRFASYPAAVETAARRATTLSDLAKIIPVESAVFGETPWTTYTVMQIADSAFAAIVGTSSGSANWRSMRSRARRRNRSVSGVWTSDATFRP